MQAMFGGEFPASEYSTGPWHRGRVDSLGLDEDGAPVIVEYEKSADSGIISQALSYLDWLCSACFEFEELARTRLGEAVTHPSYGHPVVVRETDSDADRTRTAPVDRLGHALTWCRRGGARGQSLGEHRRRTPVRGRCRLCEPRAEQAADVSGRCAPYGAGKAARGVH